MRQAQLHQHADSGGPLRQAGPCHRRSHLRGCCRVRWYAMCMRRGSHSAGRRPEPCAAPPTLSRILSHGALCRLPTGLVALVGFILLLTWGTLQAQMALAGFLNGESVWSKAQKQVAVDLVVYAETGDPAKYASFERNYLVLASYRWARDKVQSGNFEYSTVEEVLRRAQAMPVAIPSVIFALAHFADAPYMRDALHEWRTVDSRTQELLGIA